jgi:hypothetical protein
MSNDALYLSGEGLVGIDGKSVRLSIGDAGPAAELAT